MSGHLPAADRQGIKEQVTLGNLYPARRGRFFCFGSLVILSIVTRLLVTHPSVTPWPTWVICWPTWVTTWPTPLDFEGAQRIDVRQVHGFAAALDRAWRLGDQTAFLKDFERLLDSRR